MAKIAIDAGHGLHTEGKRCLKSLDPNETREWQLNERIARYVVEHLQKAGHEVKRLDDVTGQTDVPLRIRSNTANNWGADFCVSIHHNAGINGGSGGGVVSIVYLKVGKINKVLDAPNFSFFFFKQSISLCNKPLVLKLLHVSYLSPVFNDLDVFSPQMKPCPVTSSFESMVAE